MSWRTIVITKRAKLDLQLGFMVVRGEHTTKVALNEIAVVLIESTAVSLTTSLLAELTKRKVKVIFCDEKRNPSSELSAIMEVMIPVIRFVSRLRGDKIQKKLSGRKLYLKKSESKKNSNINNYRFNQLPIPFLSVPLNSFSDFATHYLSKRNCRIALISCVFKRS